MIPEEMLERFLNRGFDGLRDNEFLQLGDYLEERGTETGDAAYLFIAKALAVVHNLFLEHGEQGGVQVGFVRQLDLLAAAADLKSLLNHPINSQKQKNAKAAQKFLDAVRQRVAAYSPTGNYGN